MKQTIGLQQLLPRDDAREHRCFSRGEELADRGEQKIDHEQQAQRQAQGQAKQAVGKCDAAADQVGADQYRALVPAIDIYPGQDAKDDRWNDERQHRQAE